MSSCVNGGRENWLFCKLRHCVGLCGLQMCCFVRCLFYFSFLFFVANCLLRLSFYTCGQRLYKRHSIVYFYYKWVVFIQLKAVLKQVLMRIGSSISRRERKVNALWHFSTSNVCKYLAFGSPVL